MIPRTPEPAEPRCSCGEPATHWAEINYRDVDSDEQRMVGVIHDDEWCAEHWAEIESDPEVYVIEMAEL